MELTDEKRKEIRDAIGKRSRRIVFGFRDDAPKGFNLGVLGHMTAHKQSTARRAKKEYVDYVFKVCSEANK